MLYRFYLTENDGLPQFIVEKYVKIGQYYQLHSTQNKGTKIAELTESEIKELLTITQEQDVDKQLEQIVIFADTIKKRIETIKK